MGEIESFNRYRQRVFIIEGDWHDGAKYHCFSRDPEYEKIELVYGGSGIKKKDIVEWLFERHPSHLWGLWTEYIDGQWIYTFVRHKPTAPKEEYCDRCWSEQIETVVRRVMQVPSEKEYYATVIICDDCDYTETIGMEEIVE